MKEARKNNRKEFATLLLVLIIVLIFSFYNFKGLIITGKAVGNNDIKLEVSPDYKQISPGQRVWFTTKVNLNEEVGKEKILIYSLFDLTGNLIVSKSEKIYLENQNSFLSNLEIPQETKTGVYNLVVSISKGDGSSVKSSSRIEIL